MEDKGLSREEVYEKMAKNLKEKSRISLQRV